MNVLYEENGSFKVGSILADGEITLQVEAPHGKRAKIKARDVLLRFDQPATSELLPEAEAIASDIDIDFLWQCCGAEEFGFADLAREYCGRSPSAVEATGILVKLHSAPIYFYRRGRGRYRAAPPDTLRAALAGVERRKRLEAQIEEWAASLGRYALPPEFQPLLPALLYKPDRNRPETKALERACEQTRLSPARLLERCGALPSSHDYHLNRFLFEYFPAGTDFRAGPEARDPDGLPVAEVRAFSLDDIETTEIDDAFSLTGSGDRILRVGIHIAAPALGFAPGSDLDAVARARLSTVYLPGRKITMLPPEVIERFTLAEGRASPTLSLYLDVDKETLAIENRETRIERVPVAANLRHQRLESIDRSFMAGERSDEPYAAELHFLWRFASSLEAARGKGGSLRERPEYTFHVHDDRVRIVERARGTPLDKLVAELMITANSSWGRFLDDAGVAAIYRVQSNGKVRMTTSAAGHQGLGTSHYAWSTSPLRRYVDLVNQWQLLAFLRREPAPFSRNSDIMLAAVHDFEATYAAYDEFQGRMERYWCLRWLLQEGVQVAPAQVVRDNLVKLDGLPLYVKVPSLPPLVPGTRIELSIESVDLLDADLHCHFKRNLDS